MEWDLCKKSIHTSDSFLHSNYFGVRLNKYSVKIAYMIFIPLLHADSDVTTHQILDLDGYLVIIVKSCMPTIITCLHGFYYSFLQLPFIYQKLQYSKRYTWLFGCVNLYLIHV